MDALEKSLDKSVLVVSVMLVNNEVGTIQRIADISRLLKSYGVIFHCDAAQAPCATDIRDLTHYADLVSLSSHKMYGPQGIGALYVKRELQEFIRPIIHGGGQQNGLRSGTVPLPLCVGMAAASDLVPDASEVVRVSSLRNEFVDELQESIYEIDLNGPTSAARHPGNANLRFNGFDAHDILNRMQPSLAASTGSACTTGIPEPSHVLQALGLSNQQCESSIRFSFGRFTTSHDIHNAIEIVLSALWSLHSVRDTHSV